MSVELVATAHPTEITRQNVLDKHIVVNACLQELESARSPGERRETIERLLEAITILWQTDAMRAERPRVIDEVRRVLFFFDHILVDAAGAVHEELERLLAEAYPAITPPRALLRLRLVGRGRPGRQPQLHARADRPGARPPPRGRAAGAARAGARPRRRARDLGADGRRQRRPARLDRRRRARHAGHGRRPRRRATPASPTGASSRSSGSGSTRRASTPTTSRPQMLADLDVVAALPGRAPRRAHRRARHRPPAPPGGAVRLPHGAPRRAPALVAAARGGRGARRDAARGDAARRRRGRRDVPRAAGGDRRPRPARRRHADRQLHPRPRGPARAARAGRPRPASCARRRASCARTSTSCPSSRRSSDLRRAPDTIRALLADPRYRRNVGGPRRPPGRDGRLLRLEQGRRLPRRQPRAVPGPGAHRRRLPAARGRADPLPRARRHGQPRRRVDLRGRHGRAGRDPPRAHPDHRAGRGALVQVRPAPGGRAQPRLGAGGRAGADARGGGRRGLLRAQGRVGRGGRRGGRGLDGGLPGRWSTTTPTSCPTSSRPAPSASSGC